MAQLIFDFFHDFMSIFVNFVRMEEIIPRGDQISSPVIKLFFITETAWESKSYRKIYYLKFLRFE